jgi:hypothetical protein
MRFTPVGLLVIATVLHNQSAYLIPALIFCLIDTIIPFAIGVEIGHRAAPASQKAVPAARPAPAGGGVPRRA